MTLSCLLTDAARLLQEQAILLTPRPGEMDAPRPPEVLAQTIGALRVAAEYHRVNPLGGPASLFDTIASRIRAGEPLEAVLDDYGLRFHGQAAS